VFEIQSIRYYQKCT